MSNPQMVMYEEEFHQIQAIVARLVREANARVVFIIDKNGQLIAQAGEVDQARFHLPRVADRRKHRRDRGHGEAASRERVHHSVPRG